MLPQQSAEVREFVRAFALADAPALPHHEGMGYVRGYSAAVKHLVIAAGLDLAEMEAESEAKIEAKFAAKDAARSDGKERRDA
jgi:hypothetical protein